MITVISRFRVRNGLEAEVRKAFLHRPRLVDKTPGFYGLDVLTDAVDPSIFLLLTRWKDEDTFRKWHSSDGHHQSHEFIPAGLKLDAAFTSLTISNSLESPEGTEHISDAMEGQTAALSRWLMESEEIFALVVGLDGSIRARNRASHRVCPVDPAKNVGATIWDYLVCSDADHLKQRLCDTTGQQDGCMMLNLTDGQQSPVSLEIGLIRRERSILLVGTHEHRHDSQFQNDILKLTNELSVTTRESVRKNRELKEANEVIERLARTDVLTGLANRRTLNEALPREIARAERLGESLSVVMADLDRFKSINDTYGHLAGDHVLSAAAGIFGSRSRPYDLAARYGGEEFLLLLPGASSEAAVTIAERIREEIEKIILPDCPRPITMSLGVAAWIKGESPEQFVARADSALYQAKETGRNRVEAAVGQAPPQ